MAKTTHCKHGHEFTIDNTYVYGNGYRRCKVCVLKSNKNNYKSRKGLHRGANLKYFYGMSLAEYEQKLKDQSNKCANPNCKSIYTEDSRLHVDHDHKCCSGENKKTCGKCLRGLLCPKCNLILGLAGDSSICLSGLISYLEYWKDRKGNNE